MDTQVKGKKKQKKAYWSRYLLHYSDLMSAAFWRFLSVVAFYVVIHLSWGSPEHIKWHEKNPDEVVFVSCKVSGKTIEYTGKHSDTPEHYLLLKSPKYPRFKKSILVSREDYMAYEKGDNWGTRVSSHELTEIECPMNRGWKAGIFGFLSFVAAFLVPFVLGISTRKIPYDKELGYRFYYGDALKFKYNEPTKRDENILNLIRESIFWIPLMTYLVILGYGVYLMLIL